MVSDFSNPFIRVKGVITIIGQKTNDATIAEDGNNNQVNFENSFAFTDCGSDINNTQVNNTKYLDAFMSMYNLKEYTDD